MLFAHALTFETKLSNEFHIHRTRQNFPNNGIDTFENMAKNGIEIVDSVILNEMNGTIIANSGSNMKYTFFNFIIIICIFQ